MQKSFARLCAACALTAAALAPLAAVAGGLPIGPNVQVTDAGNTDSIETPNVAVSGNTVYAVWVDDRDNSSGSIEFAKSTDGGATWGANKRVSSLPYDAWSDDPVIAVQPNGTIWIVWWQFYRDNSNTVNDVRQAKSTDGGETFTLSILFDGANSSEDTRYPEITVDESTGKLYVLFHEFWVRGSNQGYEFSVITFDANGQKLTTKLVNDVPVPGRGSDDFLDNPRNTLTALNGVVCAAWEDTRSRFAIYGACSSDGGTTFGPNFQISGSDMVLPYIALAPDGSLYATYRGKDDPRKNVLLRRSADKGVTWGDVRNVTQQLTGSDEGRSWDLAVDDNGQLALAVAIKRGSRGDLYLATSLDQGVNFASVLVQDDQGKFPTVADQYGVSIAVGGSGTQTRAYMVWEDTRNSTNQIWSQVLSIDGIPPSAPANLQATPDDRSVLLAWNAATDSNGIYGYRVLRSTASGGPYTEITSFITPNISYRDVELDGTPYFYRVVAIDNTNNIGPASNEATATAITNAPSSANGTIAYASGNNIQLRDLPDGVARTVATGARPRFSKDGARVLYYDAKTVWGKPVAGGSPQLVFQNNNGTSWYDVADDETRVAMVLQRTGIGPPGTGLCFLFEPHYFDRNQEVYVGTNEFGENLALTPDGAWLAHNYRGFCNAIGIGTVTPGDLCIVNLATGKRKCQDAYFREPDFAPSGGWLVFTAQLTGQHEVWKAQLQGDGTLSGLTQLTRGPALQPASEPSWSSDSNWVIFKRDVDTSAGVNWQLHVVRADGAAVRNLGFAGEEPAWFGGGNAPPNPNMQPRIYTPLVHR